MQWESISPLSVIKREDQASDLRTSPKGAHLTQLITVWKPNHACAEERWDLANLQRLSGLNKIIVKNQYPIHQIHDLLD
jgi:hypothetical protein